MTTSRITSGEELKERNGLRGLRARGMRLVYLPSPNGRCITSDSAVEGAGVTRHDGWYYLFYSGDNCCGDQAHYAVMVARSRSATGPFETHATSTGAANSVILEKGGQWLAPGHNSVIQDAAGAHWLLYHAVDTRRPRARPGDDINSRRVMLLDRLIWRDGWPTVSGGAPSTTNARAPATQ